MNLKQFLKTKNDSFEGLRPLSWNQIIIMSYIHKNPETNKSVMSKDLRMTYAYITDYIKYLEIKKLVKIEKSKGKRDKKIIIMPKGQKIFRKCNELMLEWIGI